MTVDKDIAVFLSYSSEEKEEFLAALMYELTLIARDSYEAGQDGLTNPQRVRHINEVQHRLSAFLWALLRNDTQRFPDDVLVRMILERQGDDGLQKELAEAFARLTTRRVTVG
jgi:hypothetical protein